MVPSTSKPAIVPSLENGDSLTRHEFERRYHAMPHLKKVELIEGIVYTTPTVRFRTHGEPHAHLGGCLGVYAAYTGNVSIASNPTLRLDWENEPQPDVVLYVEENAGGQTHISEDDYLEGAPELIVEIAASTASIDLHAKKQAYRRNGVKEYIVWQVLDEKLSWFYLENGEYLDLPADDDGVLRSRVFLGLWLAAMELLAGNMQSVLAVLQSGLSSVEHQTFVRDLM